MNILKIIKELYTGKDNLVAQLTIFALVGIMAIAFNEVISVFTGNTLYAVFTTPSNEEVVIFSMVGVMIFIFFTGYIYKFVHENYKNEPTTLPSISMNCFTTFVKIFPVILVWGLYLGFTVFAGLALLGSDNKEFYAYIITLVVLLPFINMVFIKFAKDFKYDKKIFNPLIIAVFMEKTFMKVFLLIVQFIILAVIISGINIFLLKISTEGQSRTFQLTAVLTIICVVSYLQQVLNLAYYKGLTEIIKKSEV